jgi:hypothetical protein
LGKSSKETRFELFGIRDRNILLRGPKPFLMHGISAPLLIYPPLDDHKNLGIILSTIQSETLLFLLGR